MEHVDMNRSAACGVVCVRVSQRRRRVSAWRVVSGEAKREVRVRMNSGVERN